MTVPFTPYIRHGVVLDAVVVEGVRVSARHGLLPAEKEKPQTFLVDVVAFLDTRAAARGDDVDRTLDYAWVAQTTAAVVSGEPLDLIETLADKIATAVLGSERVEAVDVTVHKPEAPVGVAVTDVSITIRRDLRSGDLWSDKRIGSAAGLSDDPLSPEAVPPPRDALDVRPPAAESAVLAFGGNLGDVEYTLARAIDDISRVDGVAVTAVSPLVATKPVGGPEQPDFLNAVVRVQTTLAPRALLHICQGVEMIHGRERAVANGPRTLDIDLISYGALVGTSEDLVVPHPRAAQRAFVLAPWAAIEPDAVLAGQGRVADLAAAAPDAAGLTAVRNPWDPRAVIAGRRAPDGSPPAGS